MLNSTHSITATFHNSGDTERRSCCDTSYHEYANCTPYVTPQALSGACYAGLDRTEDEENDARDDAGVQEGDVCARDEEVGYEWDDAAKEVPHADGERRNIHAFVRDFL